MYVYIYVYTYTYIYPYINIYIRRLTNIEEVFLTFFFLHTFCLIKEPNSGLQS